MQILTEKTWIQDVTELEWSHAIVLLHVSLGAPFASLKVSFPSWEEDVDRVRGADPCANNWSSSTCVQTSLQYRAASRRHHLWQAFVTEPLLVSTVLYYLPGY